VTPGKVIYALLIATVLALAVVYQSATRLRIGYQLQDLRSQIVEQQAERVLYQTHLSKLRNPKRVMRLVAWLGLDLQAPMTFATEGGPEPLQPAVDVARSATDTDHAAQDSTTGVPVAAVAGL